MKKETLSWQQMTRDSAREFLNELQTQYDAKWHLPRQGKKLILSFPNRADMIEIWHGKGIFIVEQFRWGNKKNEK